MCSFTYLPILTAFL